jgi:UDP-N-acetylmuramoyl-L-alanyl-D-glutamate--2,6-diaminopimelate ligase
VASHLPFAVIVDYAHTPDGIINAIDAGRRIATSRVLVVVGAGGDRDQDKRPEMGAAAATADVVIVTSDNPRSEDPALIAGQVMGGVGSHPSASVDLDRRSAIRAVLAAARQGDVVLILGKGHEVGQEFADRIDPFNDADVAIEEAASL